MRFFSGEKGDKRTVPLSLRLAIWDIRIPPLMLCGSRIVRVQVYRMLIKIIYLSYISMGMIKTYEKINQNDMLFV